MNPREQQGARREFTTFSVPPATQVALQGSSLVARVLRAQSEGPDAQVIVQTTSEGVTSTRTHALPLQGIALPVPAGSVTVTFSAAAPTVCLASLSPGAPVLENVWVPGRILGGGVGQNVVAPPYSRGAYVTLYGGPGLVNGIAVPANGYRLPFPGETMFVENASADPMAFLVQWEVFS